MLPGDTGDGGNSGCTVSPGYSGSGVVATTMPPFYDLSSVPVANQCDVGNIEDAVPNAEYQTCDSKKTGETCTPTCEVGYVVRLFVLLWAAS